MDISPRRVIFTAPQRRSDEFPSCLMDLHLLFAKHTPCCEQLKQHTSDIQTYSRTITKHAHVQCSRIFICLTTFVFPMLMLFHALFFIFAYFQHILWAAHAHLVSLWDTTDEILAHGIA